MSLIEPKNGTVRPEDAAMLEFAAAQEGLRPAESMRRCPELMRSPPKPMPSSLT